MKKKNKIEYVCSKKPHRNREEQVTVIAVCGASGKDMENVQKLSFSLMNIVTNTETKRPSGDATRHLDM